jgi:Zn-dependent protease with chaperone function
VSLEGRYFDGKTSAARAVDVSLFDDGRVRLRAEQFETEAWLSDIKVSERIGNTQRRLLFPDGAVCELNDNDAVDRWLTTLGAHSSEHRVFQLERRWPYAIAALLLTLIGSLAFIRYGIPALAGRIAQTLPVQIDNAIGEGGLDALDEAFFAPSKLPPAKQAELQAQFTAITRELPDAQRYRLEFRTGGFVGANAFALPSGIVVMTDELVALSKHPHELTAVLAHEVGHVVHRHSLRMLLQSTGTAALMFALLGDVGSASTLAASIPTVLVHAKHSRDFEREADDYSYTWLAQHRIGREHFGAILKRLETKESGGSDSKAMSYFSSHPQTEERINR